MVPIAILSGDLRNIRLCELLRSEGHDARLFDVSEAGEAAAFGDIIVLPVKGVNSELFNGLLDRRQTLVSGEDFLQREDFAILNAIPTVEGALEVAMQDMPVTLHGSRALVIGYGRIGKLLCRALQGLGAVVSCAARKDSDFAWMKTQAIQPLHSLRLEGCLADFDVVFNTVPHLVLPHARLLELKPSCAVIDLASAPGGVDFKAAGKLGLHSRWALSLPGKCAPESAARYMKDILYAILAERGVML